MKINSYKLKSSNLYELTLENKDKLLLYDDTILKYELLIKKEIDKKLVEEIIKYNDFIEAYHISLKYIKSKLRTKKEIIKKLNNYSENCQNFVIERLQKEGYLNDSLYIKSYINDAINLKFVGPNRILYDLTKLELGETGILNYLKSIDNEIWLNKINTYILKKIKCNHNYSATILKQKIYQDLLNKGFYKEDIECIINEFDFKDNYDIYEKEYIKLKNKLIKKYSGEELDFRIKIALAKKGFKI